MFIADLAGSVDIFRLSGQRDYLVHIFLHGEVLGRESRQKEIMFEFVRQPVQGIHVQRRPKELFRVDRQRL